VSQLVEQRRQALIKTPCAKPTTSSIYIHLPICGFIYLIDSQKVREDSTVEFFTHMQPEHIAVYAGAALVTTKTSMRTTNHHDALHGALTTPERFGDKYVVSCVETPSTTDMHTFSTFRIFRFLVADETHANDILACIEWTDVFEERKQLVAYAVLRQRDPDRSRYDLYSWAILVEKSEPMGTLIANRESAFSTAIERQIIPPQTSYRLTEAVKPALVSRSGSAPTPHEISYLRLHYEDALVFILQRQQGIPFVAEMGTTPANSSHAVLSPEHRNKLDSTRYVFGRIFP
jgi:hypothetical protein